VLVHASWFDRRGRRPEGKEGRNGPRCYVQAEL